MLIFNEENKTMLLDSIQGPTIPEYMLILDLKIMDYTLAPLLILEELICPTILITIRNHTFELPASWNILVSDIETHQLDVVEIGELAGKEFNAITYGLDAKTFGLDGIVVKDYFPEFKNVGPSLSKHQMLCHPISPNTWVNISPSDTYNKYLKNKLIGDII